MHIKSLQPGNLHHMRTLLLPKCLFCKMILIFNPFLKLPRHGCSEISILNKFSPTATSSPIPKPFHTLSPCPSICREDGLQIILVNQRARRDNPKPRSDIPSHPQERGMDSSAQPDHSPATSIKTLSAHRCAAQILQDPEQHVDEGLCQEISVQRDRCCCFSHNSVAEGSRGPLERGEHHIYMARVGKCCWENGYWAGARRAWPQLLTPAGQST